MPIQADAAHPLGSMLFTSRRLADVVSPPTIRPSTIHSLVSSDTCRVVHVVTPHHDSVPGLVAGLVEECPDSAVVVVVDTLRYYTPGVVEQLCGKHRTKLVILDAGPLVRALATTVQRRVLLARVADETPDKSIFAVVVDNLSMYRFGGGSEQVFREVGESLQQMARTVGSPVLVGLFDREFEWGVRGTNVEPIPREVAGKPVDVSSRDALVILARLMLPMGYFSSVDCVVEVRDHAEVVALPKR